MYSTLIKSYTPKSFIYTPHRNISYPLIFTGLAAPIITATIILDGYKIAGPNQYLVRTGLGITDIAISKKAMVWLFQKHKFIDIHPKNYSFKLHTMSNEKIDYVLPGVFTIGPKDDKEALIRYVKTIENVDKENLDNIILGILEEETRILSSQLSMEESTTKNVQEELDKIGLNIYNANIKELEDGQDSKYFVNLKKMKLSETENKVNIDVSENNKKGDIGKKEREAETRQIVENEKRQEIEKSRALLEVIKTEAQRQIEVSKIETKNAINMRDAQLQKEVEQMKNSSETERLRALDGSRALVDAEIAVKIAEGHAKAAEISADAKLYTWRKEADGIAAKYLAQSQGIENLIRSFNGDSKQLIQYLMMENGTYQELAKENANAIKGINPKLNIWNMSGDNNNGISDVLKWIPPLFDTIMQQTSVEKNEIHKIDAKVDEVHKIDPHKLI